MKNFVIKLVLIIGGIVFVFPSSVFAASLDFHPGELGIPQPKPFTITITLDSDGESINALDGTVLIPKELGDSIVISDSGSIVTYWVEKPVWDSKTRAIKFSGAIPGGYNGDAGILFSVIISSYSGGKLDPAMSISQMHGYLNDGLGTAVKLTSTPFLLGGGFTGVLSPEIKGQLYIDGTRQDDIPPEIFDPQLARDDKAYDGKWFVSFATIDKQSGIDHYEIQESRNGSIESGKWKTVSSPVILEDQDLHSYIFVLAIDRQGNERVIKVYPRQPLSWGGRYGSDLALIGGALALIVVAGWLANRYRKKKKS